MAEKLDPKEVVTPDELAISSMWETAALIEVLERKGICNKQEVLDMFHLELFDRLPLRGSYRTGPRPRGSQSRPLPTVG